MGDFGVRAASATTPKKIKITVHETVATEKVHPSLRANDNNCCRDLDC